MNSPLSPGRPKLLKTRPKAVSGLSRSLVDTLDLLELLRYTCFALSLSLVLSRGVGGWLSRPLRLSLLISTISNLDPSVATERALLLLRWHARMCTGRARADRFGAYWALAANRVAIAPKSLISPGLLNRQSDWTLSLPRPGVRR